jgi:hypothetical protein
LKELMALLAGLPAAHGDGGNLALVLFPGVR